MHRDGPVRQNTHSLCHEGVILTRNNRFKHMKQGSLPCSCSNYKMQQISKKNKREISMRGCFDSWVYPICGIKKKWSKSDQAGVMQLAFFCFLIWAFCCFSLCFCEGRNTDKGLVLPVLRFFVLLLLG